MGTTRACALTGRPRSTLYRHRTPATTGEPATRPTPACAYAPHEKQAVLHILNSPAYADLAPAQIYARELDEGRYHCSISTMYRILRENKQTGERRAVATHPASKIPELCAEAPDQVWSWDVTRLPSRYKGIWYHLYVLMDIYSRKAIVWKLDRSENRHTAIEMVQDGVARNNGIIPGWLHSDRGTAATSQDFSDLLANLAIVRSHSRPRVSNDNPYSEAAFKTLKYDPWYPRRFEHIDHAADWADEFFEQYNHHHRHSGIGYYTPASVHHGTWELLRDTRQRTLDAAYTANPARFRHHRPTAPTIPTQVWINDPERTLTKLEQTTTPQPTRSNPHPARDTTTPLPAPRHPPHQHKPVKSS